METHSTNDKARIARERGLPIATFEALSGQAARIQARREPQEPAVTAAMLNAITDKAVAVVRNDLREYSCIHRDDGSIYDGLERQGATILAVVEKTVNAIMRDPSKPLPETCGQLGERLRDPENKRQFEDALKRSNCCPSRYNFLVDDFGKMMRKLAKDAQAACQQGRSI